MNQFSYTITDPLGLHARPAGMLVKKVKELSCPVTLTKGDKSIDASKLFSVMGLGVKQGDVLRFSLSGENEDSAAEELLLFLQQNA